MKNLLVISVFRRLFRPLHGNGNFHNFLVSCQWWSAEVSGNSVKESVIKECFFCFVTFTVLLHFFFTSHAQWRLHKYVSAVRYALNTRMMIPVVCLLSLFQNATMACFQFFTFLIFNYFFPSRIPIECSLDSNKFPPPPPINASQPPIKKIKIPTSALSQLAEDSDSGISRKKTGTTSPTTPSKGKSSRANGKKRSNHEATSPTPIATAEESIAPVKKNKIKIVQNGSGAADSTFDCTEPNCGRKYKNKGGLLNHRRIVHSKKQESADEKVSCFHF